MVFGVFLYEVFLRFTTDEPENLAKLKASSLFLFENKSNVKFPYLNSTDNYNVLAVFNSDGFRDDEFKVEKDVDVFRIAVLGDSFEEALQVELADTWQKVLMRKLEGDLKRKVEVYNFGVSGYGTDQEWLTLKEKVWKYKPDLVILAFTANDIGDAFKNKLVVFKGDELYLMKPDERLKGNRLGSFARRTYIYHMLIRAGSANVFGKRIIEKVRTKVLGFPKEEKFFLSDAQLVQGPFEIVASQNNPPNEVLEGWRIVKALIWDMKKQADENGAKFLVTVNVSKMQIIPSDWEKLRDLYQIDPVDSSPFEISKVLGDFLHDKSIDFYDPIEDAKTWYSEKGDLHYRQDAHYNRNGHLFMGESTARFVIDHEIVN